MIKPLSAVLALLLAGISPPALAASWRPVPFGAVVTPDTGRSKSVRVQAYGDGTFRVTAVPDGDLSKVDRSLMVIAQPSGAVKVSEAGGEVTLKMARASARISLADGTVKVTDKAGHVVLAEAAPAGFTPVTLDGKPFLATMQQFNRGTDEAFYGLGQHQKAQMDYNGEDIELAQHNTDIAVPFVLSTRNYGVLWDNNSITRFGNPKPYELAGTDGLTVTGEDGRPGFTARYSLDGKLAVARQEPTINYQFTADQASWPAAAKARTVAATTGQNTAGNAIQQQTVVWTGTVSSDKPGLHRFQLYSSSYVKLFVDGKLVIDRWRQNWNPWFRDFDVPMAAGEHHAIRIEWQPNQGYIALLHNDPVPEVDRHSLRFSSEVAHSIDYYVVTADNLDGVVAGYRRLTGKAPIMPEWAYGFWQSRQRYETQAQIVDVVKSYRDRHIPIDNVVEDWFYWKPDQWGSHEFDATRFPDPKGMIDTLHGQHAHFMISVWAKFYPTTANFRELAAVNGVYRGNLDAGRKDWVGYPNTDYDPYNPQARAIYWRQMKERLAVLGVDGWWMDATEPDIQSNISLPERLDAMGPTYAGPAAQYFNSFPLVHAEGVAGGLKAFAPDKRSFILTRSGFGGLQRTGSAIWSGDTAARWDDFRDQIAAGVNASMSGIPNWTFDIGGFSVEDRYSKQDPAALAEWQELNLRWFQFGALAPIFRSHGEFPHREIYEIAPEGSPMRASMIWYDQLRYRLIPYLYSLGAGTWFDDGSIMRGLVMDFPNDKTARTVADEYLLGRALLVAPVTTFQARTRPVYLPAGAIWYDFYSGQAQQGGRTIEAAAPFERMPLFVRAGSIVPIGPAIEWTRQDERAPIRLNVYTGADGAFTLYADDGVSRAYQRGDYARIPVRWDEHSRTLILGTQEGRYTRACGRSKFAGFTRIAHVRSTWSALPTRPWTIVASPLGSTWPASRTRYASPAWRMLMMTLPSVRDGRLKIRRALARMVAASLLLGIGGAADAAPAGVAPRPPMGWNSWDAYGFTIDEAQFKANVALLARWKGLGWSYAVIDEGWYMGDPGGADLPARRYQFDGYGRLEPVVARFPSAADGHGLRALAAWTHAQGLKFGIHVVRGIPKEAVDANRPIAGSRFHAADAADRTALCPWDKGNYGVADNDAGQAYYDSLVKEYADWGVDFLKVDCISDHPYRPTEIRQIGNAIRKAGRPMVLSLSPGPARVENLTEMARSAQMWRIMDDFWDAWTFPHPDPTTTFPNGVRNGFDSLALWSRLAGPERWPDADMLPFGSLRPHPGWGEPRQSRLTPAEVRTNFALWAIARSPLILGGNLMELDERTAAVLTNPRVIALDQEDRVGLPAPQLPASLSEARVWLSAPRGSAPDTIAIFNLSEQPLALDAAWSELGLRATTAATCDLFTGAQLAPSSRLRASVASHDVLLLRVEPARLPRTCRPSRS